MAILSEVRALVSQRASYGYRRITALLNRARKRIGEPLLRWPMKDEAEKLREGRRIIRHRDYPDRFASSLVARTPNLTLA